MRITDGRSVTIAALATCVLLLASIIQKTNKSVLSQNDVKYYYVRSSEDKKSAPAGHMQQLADAEDPFKNMKCTVDGLKVHQ